MHIEQINTALVRAKVDGQTPRHVTSAVSNNLEINEFSVKIEIGMKHTGKWRIRNRKKGA